jgi:hypothetical protein
MIEFNYMNTELEIQNLKERNKRVELDKAWERSWTRRLTIMVLTFIVASIWLLVIKESHVLLKAMVPTLGYLLSTLSIPQIKKIWVETREK